jgi:RNA polymerase sigma-70 factor (ECF subfamily)
LTVAYREPLLLKAIEGLSQRQIAEVMGLSEEAVETRLARARRLLRERLAVQEGEPGDRRGSCREPRRERQTR